MRRFILLIAFLTSALPAIGAPLFDSQESFSKWLTFYYENPEPKQVPEAVIYMSRTGVLDNGNVVAPILGFLSGVIRANPDSIDPWIKKLRNLKEKHFGVVVLGVWYANLPDSKARVSALLKSRPNLKDEFSYINQGAPIAVEQIPLEQGPWVLDALWGKFMATGDSAPVERIITALPWVDVKGDVNRLLVGGSARWSLISNAVQHKRVKEICEASLKTANAEVASKLNEVLAEANKELQERHNPAVQGTLRDEAAQRP